MNNSMMLVTGSWGNNKTFKMIPVTNDCPYNEAIFDRDGKVLALIGKEKKESFHMLPKLSDDGDVLHLKIGRRSNGKDYKEERKLLETYYEYYIENPEEIEQVVKSLATNADTFDFKQYMEAAATQPSQIVTV